MTARRRLLQAIILGAALWMLVANVKDWPFYLFFGLVFCGLYTNFGRGHE